MEGLAAVLMLVGTIIVVSALAGLTSDCAGDQCGTFTGFAIGWLVFGAFFVAIGIMLLRLRD